MLSFGFTLHPNTIVEFLALHTTSSDFLRCCRNNYYDHERLLDLLLIPKRQNSLKRRKGEDLTCLQQAGQ